LELQAISRLVDQQLTGQGLATPVKSTPAPIARTARLARLLFLGICGLFGGAGLLALDKRLGANTPLWWIGLSLVLGCTMLTLYAVLEPMMFPQNSVRKLAPSEAPVAAETTSKLALAAASEPVLSVTEQTTRNLEPVSAEHQE
jgi:hypothetical protein